MAEERHVLAVDGEAAEGEGPATYLGDPTGDAEFEDGAAHVTVAAQSTAACLFQLTD